MRSSNTGYPHGGRIGPEKRLSIQEYGGFRVWSKPQGGRGFALCEAEHRHGREAACGQTNVAPRNERRWIDGGWVRRSSSARLSETWQGLCFGESHYWGEPLYGYYDSADPWVLRRHPNSWRMQELMF
jgi:hypothetical protein